MWLLFEFYLSTDIDNIILTTGYDFMEGQVASAA